MPPEARNIAPDAPLSTVFARFSARFGGTRRRGPRAPKPAGSGGFRALQGDGRWASFRLPLRPPPYINPSGLKGRASKTRAAPPLHRGGPDGGVPERSIGAVSKTVVPVRVPWVRIPPPPPILPGRTLSDRDRAAEMPRNRAVRAHTSGRQRRQRLSAARDQRGDVLQVEGEVWGSGCFGRPSAACAAANPRWWSATMAPS